MKAPRYHFKEALALVVAVAAALSVQACGGGGSTATTNQTAAATAPAAAVPAATHLIAQADAICQRLNGRIFSQPGSGLLQIQRIGPKNAKLERAAIRELERLVPPPKLLSKWQKFLGYRQLLAQQLLTLVEYQKRNDKPIINAVIREKLRNHHRMSDEARRLGLKDCGTLG